MPSIDVPQFSQVFAVDGGVSGSIQVAASAGFYVGCIAYLSRDSNPGARCIIVDLPDATHVGVRIVADDNENQQQLQRYGARSDLTGWTTALNSKISMPAQLARVEPQTVKPALNV
jgi:hypothetical protein